MGAQQGYYDNLDLKYPEIGIAMQVIDRLQPGRVAFSIPVLTPNMNNTSKTSTKVIQRDKSNIQNDNRDAVDVSDIEVSNVLYIELPRELCALPGAYYDVSGRFNGVQDGSGNGSITIHGNLIANGTASINGRLKFSGNINGSCSIGGPVRGASFSGSGSIQGASSFSGTGSIQGTITSSASRNNVGIQSIDGRLGMNLNKSSRYIPAGSKWLIAFIGGDISCPVVVCRLPDSAGSPVTEDSPIDYSTIDGNEGVDPFPDMDLEDFEIIPPIFEEDEEEEEQERE